MPPLLTGRRTMTVTKNLSSYAAVVAIAIAWSLCCGRADADIIGFHVDATTGHVNTTGHSGGVSNQITGELYFDTATGLADHAALVFEQPGDPLYMISASYFGSQFLGNNARS